MPGAFERFFGENENTGGFSDAGTLMDTLYLALDVLLETAGELMQERDLGLRQLWRRHWELAGASDGCRREAGLLQKHIENRLGKSAWEVRLPFAAFSERMRLSGWQKLSLILGGACDRDPGYGTLFAAWSQNPGRCYATKGLVWALAVLAGGDGEAIYQEMLSEQFFFRVCFRKADAVLGEPFWEEPLVLNRRLVCCFNGRQSGLRAEEIIRYHEPAGRRPVCFWEEHCRELERLWQAGRENREQKRTGETAEKQGREGAARPEQKTDAIVLLGRKGSGRKFLVTWLSEQTSQTALFISCDCLRKAQDRTSLYDLLYLELQAEDGFLCVTDWEGDGGEGKKGQEKGDGDDPVTELLWYMKRQGECVILTAAGQILGRVDGQQINYAQIGLEEPGSRQREAMWRYFLGQMQDGLDVPMLAGRYMLNAGEIHQAVLGAVSYRDREGRDVLRAQDVLRALRQCHAHLSAGCAWLLESTVCLNDLVVSQETEELLQALCSRVKYKALVGERWGFYDGVSYGRGICALFYGPPGTGKTMAAQALANELGLDLYRIDLSGMMSKYIGETEKNISRLFERAKGSNALLFFDEADALFSRRTQVNDTHDRNANGQVAHLLQKLEAYEGISILATNLKDHMDDAFSRRISYMIPFPFPDEGKRRALWKKMLPKGAPVEDTLALDWFAAQFELTGSEIRETLFQAAVAAAREGCGMKNVHIAEAVRRCLAKYGRVVTEEELGEMREPFFGKTTDFVDI